MSLRLAVCAEMVYGELPLVERVERIHEQGFDVELWDTRGRDIAALAATGASFSSMATWVPWRRCSLPTSSTTI